MDGVLLLVYIITFSCVIAYACSIRLDHIGFEDGVLIGLLFFILAPVTIALIEGGISSLSMLAGPFRPLHDHVTSLQICIGCFLIIAFHWLARRLIRPAGRGRGPVDRKHGGKLVIGLFMATYVVCNTIYFLSSGKIAGGHWQGNLEIGLKNNLLLIVIGNFSNVFRGAIFGVLYNSYTKNLVTKKTVILVGFVVVAFDVLTTFNRITAAYYAITLLLVYRRHFPVIALASIPVLPVVGYLSMIWSSLRGLAIVDGYSLSGFANAASVVNSAIASGAMQFGQSINGIFDSENIIVLDWIVKNTGQQFPILYGYTFFLRPITVLIPSFFWPEKPGVFGVMVGGHLQGISGLALNSTIFGEAFGNFYYFWPIPLFFMLLVLSFIFTRLSRRWPFIDGASFFVGFALWRFDMSFAFISLLGLSGVIVAWTVVNRFFARSRSRHRRPLGAPPVVIGGRMPPRSWMEGNTCQR